MLFDTDFKQRSDTNTWSHRDGSPFTQEEQDAVFAATRDELEEVSDQITRYRAYRQSKEEAPEALHRFLAPFLDQLVQDHLHKIIESMTEDELTELDRLLGAVDDPILPFTPNTF
ncbi:hypothetical protein [Streptomyces sp. NPDC005538]|uniref:hypothetical protein n=1 Tax=unclassified Streptomyces TaxID=2593676 RepID=UPI0033B48A76